MSALINRGSRHRPRRFTPSELRERQQQRELAAARRKTHHYIGVICPACGHRQLLEIPLPGAASLGTALGEIPVGAEVLRTHCELGGRREDNLRRAAGLPVDDCRITLEVALRGPDAMPNFLDTWREWSRHRYAWESRRDRIAAATDGYQADPKTWGHLPAPKRASWDRPDPPFAVFDALRGLFAVRLLEQPPMSKESLYVDLNLPGGRYIRARVNTSHQAIHCKSNRHQLAELVVPMPIDDKLRGVLLNAVLRDYPDDRALLEESRVDLKWTFPYGTEPFCWTRGSERRQGTSEILTTPPAAPPASTPPAASASAPSAAEVRATTAAPPETSSSSTATVGGSAAGEAPVLVLAGEEQPEAEQGIQAGAPAAEPLPLDPAAISPLDDAPASPTGTQTTTSAAVSFDGAEESFFGDAADPEQAAPGQDDGGAAAPTAADQARRDIEAKRAPEPQFSERVSAWWQSLITNTSTDHGEAG